MYLNNIYLIDIFGTFIDVAAAEHWGRVESLQHFK